MTSEKRKRIKPEERIVKEKFKDIKTEYNIKPRNGNQSIYLNALKNDSVVICLGPAGTGKTFMAAAFAANELLQNRTDKIILTRSNIPVGKSVGFFPGTIDDKMGPWLAPLTSIIKIVIGPGAFDCALKKGNIEMVPLEVIRGRSWDNSIIIIDESQNLTIEEIKAISTRIGEKALMVFCGDISQSDLSKSEGGLSRFCDIIEKYEIPNTSIIEFTIDDIVRSNICGALVRAFYSENL